MSPPVYEPVDLRQTGERRVVAVFADPDEALAAAGALLAAGDRTAHVAIVGAQDPLVTT